LRQAIDRLVRKLIVSPRRHRKIRRCGLSDIVKRRSLRAFGRDENLARRAISSIKRNAHREWKHSPMNIACDACRPVA
jgi:hypothetical protein